MARNEGNGAVSREAKAVDSLVEAKDAYRDDPSEENRSRRNKAVEKVQKIRAEERADRGNAPVIGGDAYVTEG